MASILLRLSIDQSAIEYVLTCKLGDTLQESLIQWLTSKNIALCTQEEYDNPDILHPLNIYCVPSGKEMYKLFQVLVTSDWDDKENPPPQFVNDVAWLAWVIIPPPSPLVL
jgi:hypothetical protein